VILEAHRSGISIHRIAQIFREGDVDISTQHLMRAIRLFIAEEEGTKGKASAVPEGRPGPDAAEEKQKGPVTYQISEQPAAMVREEEFAKQLRLARYLAGASFPPSRPLEPALALVNRRQTLRGTDCFRLCRRCGLVAVSYDECCSNETGSNDDRIPRRGLPWARLGG
jgi:hypothetical protein